MKQREEERPLRPLVLPPEYALALIWFFALFLFASEQEPLPLVRQFVSFVLVLWIPLAAELLIPSERKGWLLSSTPLLKERGLPVPNALFPLLSGALIFLAGTGSMAMMVGLALFVFGLSALLDRLGRLLYAKLRGPGPRHE